MAPCKATSVANWHLPTPNVAMWHSLMRSRFTYTLTGKVDFRTRTCHKAVFDYFLAWFWTPPPVHMLLQRKKANSLVPAIISPLHGLFRKRGGDWYWYPFFSSLFKAPWVYTWHKFYTPVCGSPSYQKTLLPGRARFAQNEGHEQKPRKTTRKQQTLASPGRWGPRKSHGRATKKQWAETPPVTKSLPKFLG